MRSPDAAPTGITAGRSELVLTFGGIVERGDQRGRTLGFATANLPVERSSGTPPEGVYAGVAVTAEGAAYRAAVSLGRRPTFYEDGFELLEAHLLDFDGDLYDTPLSVHLHRRIRGQVRFDTVDSLVAQLRRDVARTRELIGEELLGG